MDDATTTPPSWGNAQPDISTDGAAAATPPTPVVTASSPVAPVSDGSADDSSVDIVAVTPPAPTSAPTPTPAAAPEMATTNATYPTEPDLSVPKLATAPVEPEAPAPAAERPTEPADIQKDPTAKQTVSIEDAYLAYGQALETRIAARLQKMLGDAALDEYLKIREKDDLAEMLLFEARYHINIDHLFRDEEAALIKDMEDRQPGSTSFLLPLVGKKQASHE